MQSTNWPERMRIIFSMLVKRTMCYYYFFLDVMLICVIHTHLMRTNTWPIISAVIKKRKRRTKQAATCAFSRGHREIYVAAFLRDEVYIHTLEDEVFYLGV